MKYVQDGDSCICMNSSPLKNVMTLSNDFLGTCGTISTITIPSLVLVTLLGGNRPFGKWVM